MRSQIGGVGQDQVGIGDRVSLDIGNRNRLIRGNNHVIAVLVGLRWSKWARKRVSSVFFIERISGPCSAMYSSSVVDTG